MEIGVVAKDAEALGVDFGRRDHLALHQGSQIGK